MTFESLLHLHLYNVSIHFYFFKIIEKSQNLFTKLKSDLQLALRSNVILWKICVLIVLVFTPNFNEIRFQTNNISKKKWIFNWKDDLMCPSMTSEVINTYFCTAVQKHKIRIDNFCLHFFLSPMPQIFILYVLSRT